MHIENPSGAKGCYCAGCSDDALNYWVMLAQLTLEYICVAKGACIK